MSVPDPAGAGSSSGILTSAKALLHTLVRVIRTRLELAVVELEEERERLLLILLSAVIAVFLLSFGLLLITLFFVVLFWDANRLLALGIATGLYVAGGIAAALTTRRLIAKRPKLFTTTLEELKKDIQGLQE